MGLGGLGTDIQTFSALMEQKVNLYTLKENKPMKPNTFCNLVAYSLFEKRYDIFLTLDLEAILFSRLWLGWKMENQY